MNTQTTSDQSPWTLGRPLWRWLLESFVRFAAFAVTFVFFMQKLDPYIRGGLSWWWRQGNRDLLSFSLIYLGISLTGALAKSRRVFVVMYIIFLILNISVLVLISVLAGLASL